MGRGSCLRVVGVPAPAPRRPRVWRRFAHCHLCPTFGVRVGSAVAVPPHLLWRQRGIAPLQVDVRGVGRRHGRRAGGGAGGEGRQATASGLRAPQTYLRSKARCVSFVASAERPRAGFKAQVGIGNVASVAEASAGGHRLLRKFARTQGASTEGCAAARVPKRAKRQREGLGCIFSSRLAATLLDRLKHCLHFHASTLSAARCWRPCRRWQRR